MKQKDTITSKKSGSNGRLTCEHKETEESVHNIYTMYILMSQI